MSALLAITDRAHDAQCALSAIKSFAYGGSVDEREARERAAELRRQVEAIEALINGQTQEPLSR